LKSAHSENPSQYNNAISGSVRDYRLLLNWIHQQYSPQKIIALGYSMGAQMSLLLTRYEPGISAVLAMVPPYVTSPSSPVAPRVHTPHIINANVVWLAADKDQFSDKQGIQETFDLIRSRNKKIQWFDRGHRLPLNYIEHGLDFINSLEAQ
jgi:dienelactone hydrolase